jgi:hypothetical protein
VRNAAAFEAARPSNIRDTRFGPAEHFLRFWPPWMLAGRLVVIGLLSVVAYGAVRALIAALGEPTFQVHALPADLPGKKSAAR